MNLKYCKNILKIILKKLRIFNILEKIYFKIYQKSPAFKKEQAAFEKAIKGKKWLIFCNGGFGDLYYQVNFFENKNIKNEDIIFICNPQSFAPDFFKTQNFSLQNFYKYSPKFGRYLDNLRTWGIWIHYKDKVLIKYIFWFYHEIYGKIPLRRIQISNSEEKKILIIPTANSLRFNITKNFWLQLAEKIEKETHYKVAFRSHSPNPSKFKEYSDTKISEIFSKVLGKNTIVIALRSGFCDALRTCDLKNLIILQTGLHDFYHFSKEKNHFLFMENFEYVFSDTFGKKEIGTIIEKIKNS